MRLNRWILPVAFMAAGLLAAKTGQAEEPKFAEPILLTSCGQSADVLMMKTLLTKDSLSFVYVPAANGDDVTGKGSVLFVLGGSSKGLGAAKISEADEMARVKSIAEAADKDHVPMLAAHIGGVSRRGALSDPFNQWGAEHAAYMIVVKSGNADSLFSKIADDRKITLESADNALATGKLVKQLYRR